jgi:hypothetical protein
MLCKAIMGILDAVRKGGWLCCHDVGVVLSFVPHLNFALLFSLFLLSR